MKPISAITRAAGSSATTSSHCTWGMARWGSPLGISPTTAPPEEKVNRSPWIPANLQLRPSVVTGSAPSGGTYQPQAPAVVRHPA